RGRRSLRLPSPGAPRGPRRPPRPRQRAPRPSRRPRSSLLEPAAALGRIRPATLTRGGRRTAPDGVLRSPRGVSQTPDRLSRGRVRDVPRLLELGPAALRVHGPSRAAGPASRPEPLLHDSDRALPDVLPGGSLRRDHRGLTDHPLAGLALR